MSRYTILIVTAQSAIASELAARLSRQHYTVIAAKPGAGVMQAVRHARPDLAVLDRIDTRPDAAQLEVAVLKDQCPGVPIIVLSEASSQTDGAVIEQGVFCYLAGASVDELIRVIEAAQRERRPTHPSAVTSIPTRSVT